MGRPILSPGKKLTGGKFRPVTPEMESRINKLANITDNGPQCPSETTWSLPIMMLRNWKSFFFFLFLFYKAIKKVMRGF